MRSKTGVIWLDNTIEQADKAGFPHLRDREDCCLLYSRLIGQPVALETYRRLRIPTVVIHGRAKQRPADVVAKAKSAIEQAAPHMPTPSPRRREIG
jgi:hypothetical protein